MAKQSNQNSLTFYPATAPRWADVEELFGNRGACGGCWCMFWRVPRKEFEQNKGVGNKRAFKRIITSGREPGIIAYAVRNPQSDAQNVRSPQHNAKKTRRNSKEPIGWCAVAPREQYVALERSRILKPVDDTPVWSISCLFIKKPYRRKGVSSLLLRAAVDFAASRGASVVEGYPVEPSMDKMPDPFLWHGVPSAFKAAGFKEVLRRSESRPIMRFEIKRAKAGTFSKAKRSP